MSMKHVRDAVAQRVDVPSSGGRPLPDGVRGQMESAFRQDFGAVRVHQGNTASQLGAVAFTRGEDVHFQPSAFDPGSRTGRQLIAHELAHVVQQREGRVRPTSSVSGVPLNDDRSLEGEADRLAAKAVR